MATINDLTANTALDAADLFMVETASGPRSIAGSVLSGTFTTKATTIVTSAGSRTLVLTDADRHIRVTAGGSVTVPTNASVAFSIGSSLTVERATTAAVGIVAASGVTLRAYPGLNLAGQWATCALLKVAADEWLVAGALSS